MFERILVSRQIEQICKLIKAGGVVKLSGVWGSSAPMLAAAIGVRKSSGKNSPPGSPGRRRGKPGAPLGLLVCTHLDDADALADDLEVLSGRSAELFPAWELRVPGTPEGSTIPVDHVSDEIIGERLRICTRLANPAGTPDAAEFIVAPVAALMQPVPSPAALAASRLSLRQGSRIDPEKLAEWLVDAGFDSVEAVDQQGEFARRGGIVDIFPHGQNQPFRVEFFGDQVESIRCFDLDSQRSTVVVDGCDLVGTASGRATDPGKTTHLLEYLPRETIIFVVEPVEVLNLAETFYRRLDNPAGVHTYEELLTAMREFPRVDISTFGSGTGVPPVVDEKRKDDAPLTTATVGTGTNSVPVAPERGVPVAPEGRVDVGIRSIARLEMNTHEALEELENLTRDSQVWVYCENLAERQRFAEVLAASHPKLAKAVKIGIGHVSRGFYWPAEKLAVVGHHEIFHRYAHPRRLRRVRAGRPIDSFVDLQDGDYVVHVGHGIARFEGLRTLEKAGRKEEYLTLKFAEGALLHVPVTEIHLVQKYIGARRGHPTLSHLGAPGWSARKAKVAAAVHEMAADLLRLQAMRASSPGVSYPGDSEWMRQFEGEFPYEETEDQLSAMQQIGADLGEPRPMDRLLCGDVGFGKTELAMRAAFRVAEAGKQVAVLVPTTVLAAQHYRTFKERFADYPFRIDVISRFRTGGDQTEIIGRTADGSLDVLIGTHRLLSQDINFADLGLVIIDEEQRFGVEHKERLKAMRASVDVLTMTATPIPRTLHMALLGLRDISNLMTPPVDRRAIYTEVCQASDQRLRQAILAELNRGGQVFYVHNRVAGIESVADHIRHLAPEARVGVGHGQMKEHELEKTWLRFLRGEIDVLVCTTIIESGLDIPSANTMFIDEADRFGLAELHQLRGRIGRYKHRAYCYLLLPTRRPVSRTAAKRLKAVEEFSDLGAGFQIAMRDLEIRGAGNILGPEQSGHIAAVGYELYCQMLERAVKGLRGDKTAPPKQAHVELAVEGYVPRTYIASSRQRMEVYRRMGKCLTAEEVEQLAKDLADAYGPTPPVVDALLTVAQIRVMAGRLGIDSMILMPPDVVFTFHDPKPGNRALAGLAGTVRLADEKTAHWRPPPVYLQQPTLLTVLRRQFERVLGKGRGAGGDCH